jgi:queuosine precursor transporter
MKLKPLAIVLAIAYIASIWLAVVAIDRFGVVEIADTGLFAPAAVYVVGVTLVIRDFLQDALRSRAGMIALIVVGSLVSAFVNPHLAIASGAAFLIAETLDYLIYTPIRERNGRLAGIAISNAVSIPVDSLIFLSLAFGSLAFLPGQIVGKAFATLLALVVVGLVEVVRVDRTPVGA